MITITFEIPEEIAEFIKTELKTEPKTYIQNKLINPIIDKYEKNIRSKKLELVEAAVKAEAAQAKSDMKITLTAQDKLRKK